jgi:general secretion pathway protein D
VFKRGFEFALSSGNFGATTKGAFGLNEIAGVALNWSSGLNEVVANFVEENSQINILSKPTLLVRDGTDASINIGDRVPVSAGSTTGTSGDIITENISYQETGIRLTVAPTVNARGVIIMKITQDISNQVEGQIGKAGNPIFFERNLMTEVVVDSGQTILLGGLISENTSNTDKGVPFFKSIPLVGAFFESEAKSDIKNELVIMVTAKIVERSSQWQSILNKFQIELESIDMNQ